MTTLEQTVARFEWLCHAYVLMGNHYHLLIETPKGNLSRGMRHLNGVFTQGVNRLRRRVGHLFQGRFSAILIDRDVYLLEVCRYIVLNPVRAGMVADPGEWPWSSYSATAGSLEAPRFLATDWIRSQFGNERTGAGRAYRNFVRNGIGTENPFLEIQGQFMLGTQRLASEIGNRVAPKAGSGEVPRSQRRIAEPELEEIFQSGTRRSLGRDEIVYQAYMKHGYSLREIGEHLGLHYSSISLAIKRVEESKNAI